MNCWTTYNEQPPLQKPNRTLLTEHNHREDRSHRFASKNQDKTGRSGHHRFGLTWVSPGCCASARWALRSWALTRTPPRWNASTGGSPILNTSRPPGWPPCSRPGEGAGQFAATHDLGRLGEPDVLIICVPTPLTSKREPDLRYVEQTTRQIAACLRPANWCRWNPPPTPAPPPNCCCPSWANSTRWGRKSTWSSLPNGKTRATPPFR